MGLRRALFLGDLAHSGFLTPGLVHLHDLLALVLSGFSNRRWTCEERKLLRCAIEHSQFLFPLISAREEALELDRIRAFEQPRLLKVGILRATLRFHTALVCWVDEDLVRVFDAGDSIPPLVPYQLGTPFYQHDLLALLLHLTHLLTGFPDVSPALTRHLK